MALAQKQKWRAVEHNRGPGHDSTQLCLPNFQQSCQKHMVRKTASSINIAGKTGDNLPAELKLDPCLSPCIWVDKLKVD
jgi:hypothetical protein